MAKDNIRPDYYKSCGEIGRRILTGCIAKQHEELLDKECRLAIKVACSNDFDLGNALKYLWRVGKKEGCVADDLVKARFYLESSKDMFRPHKSIELIDKMIIRINKEIKELE